MASLHKLLVPIFKDLNKGLGSTWVCQTPTQISSISVNWVFSLKRVSDHWVRIWFELVLEITLGILRALGFSQTSSGMPWVHVWAWEDDSGFLIKLWFWLLLNGFVIIYTFSIQSLLVRSPEISVLAQKGKIVFLHSNLDTDFKILKPSEIYTFWKIDFSRITLSFFVDLVRGP